MTRGPALVAMFENLRELTVEESYVRTSELVSNFIFSDISTDNVCPDPVGISPDSDESAVQIVATLELWKILEAAENE